MAGSVAAPADPRARAASAALVAAAILVGTFAVCHRQLLSGFTLLQVFPQDPLFQAWTLEHLWLWIAGAPGHAELWSPPTFHPRPGVLAFGDPMLGLFPFYGLARALGGDPYLAYALAAIGALALTFVAHFWLYRAGFDLPARWAALGAYLVAYGAPRAAALNHPHQFAQFPAAVALLAFVRALDLRRGPCERSAWAAALPLLLVVQLWANVYLGVLAGILLLGAAATALCGRDGRRAVAGLGRQGAAAALLGSLLAALLAMPLAVGLAGSYGELAGPPAEEVDLYLPRLASWLNPGPDHLLEPWLAGALGLTGGSTVEWAHRLGVGLLTTVLVLAGLVAARHDARLRWVAGGVAGLVLVSLRIDGVGALWNGLIALVDPLRSLRVVGRVGLVALALWGAALAHAAWRLETRARRALLALLVVFVVVEQVSMQPAFELAPRRQRALAIAAAVPPDCDSFYYSAIRTRGRAASSTPREGAVHQVDAMWAALAAARPTLNGYSSHGPPDWPLWGVVSDGSAEALAATRSRLADWVARSGLDGETVCWLRGKVRRQSFESIVLERIVAPRRR